MPLKCASAARARLPKGLPAPSLIQTPTTISAPQPTACCRTNTAAVPYPGRLITSERLYAQEHERMSRLRVLEQPTRALSLQVCRPLAACFIIFLSLHPATLAAAPRRGIDPATLAAASSHHQHRVAAAAAAGRGGRSERHSLGCWRGAIAGAGPLALACPCQ